MRPVRQHRPRAARKDSMSTQNFPDLQSVGTTDAQNSTITGPQLATDRYGAPDHYYYECHDCGEQWAAAHGRDAHTCTEGL